MDIDIETIKAYIAMMDAAMAPCIFCDERGYNNCAWGRVECRYCDGRGKYLPSDWWKKDATT